MLVVGLLSRHGKEHSVQYSKTLQEYIIEQLVKFESKVMFTRALMRLRRGS